jgi:hypothetical protein
MGVVCSSSPGECSTGVYGINNGTGCLGIGVAGVQQGSGWGVYGYTPRGIGVRGASACGIGVLALADAKNAKPLAVRAAKCQVAHLQEWQDSCGLPFSVVSSAGYLGIGTSSPVYPLCVSGFARVEGMAVDGSESVSGNISTSGILYAENVGINIAGVPQRKLCVSGRGHISCGLGLGTQTINTTLAVNGSIAAKTRVVTKSATLAATDFAIFANGAITLTLPPASTQNGMLLFIKNVSTASTTPTVSVKPASADTIEGTSSKTLSSKYASLTLVSNGSNEWYVLASAT